MSSGDIYCSRLQLKSLFDWEPSQCFGQLTLDPNEQCTTQTLPDADPLFVIRWCLAISWLLAAKQPKSTTESVTREQVLGNLDESRDKDKMKYMQGDYKYIHPSVVCFNRYVMFIIYHFCPAHPSKGTSMVSVSSTWIGRQSLTSSFFSGANSSMPLTDRPGATNWNELDAVNLNNCRKKQ